MAKWLQNIKSFPLTVETVIKDYLKMPAGSSGIFYHYTTHTGLTGIIRSGGLRATYRMRMNDTNEFGYAREMVYKILNYIGKYNNPPKVLHSLTTYTRKNLDKFLKDTIELSRAYCACLTVSSDDPKQWETYAENGRGFAIGFYLSKILNIQIPRSFGREPFIFCAPVTYDKQKQCDLVHRLLEAGFRDLQTFAETYSQRSEDLTALSDRIKIEIVNQLFALIDFIKAPAYSFEREIRLALDSNDGTFKAPKVEYFEREGESIPFIFFDLHNPKTKRLPLAEIKIGPKASFIEEKVFLENLLDELSYGSNYEDRPRITQSAKLETGI